VAWWSSWRGDGTAALAGAPAPGVGAAAVFIGREDARVDRTLRGSPWAEVRRRALAPRVGDHEGAGGFAAAAAVAAIEGGVLARALILGGAPDRGYAVLFVAPGSA
jgi:3-oxoacyl-[acyl-carrier-protein] synthase II